MFTAAIEVLRCRRFLSSLDCSSPL
uniref:Uncharacterized protein n=1 Tax=Arundo donax TaxID=35708 RepID=A0A0A8Z7E8_ARUDO